MMYKIIEMSLKNFKGYTDSVFNFSDVNEIKGPNAKGKTSIADAISFCICGQSFFGEKSNYKIHNDKFPGANAVIEMKLLNVSNNDVLEIKREFNPKKTSTVYIDGKKTTQKELSKIIPPDLFLSIFSKDYFQNLGDEKMRKLIEEYTEDVQPSKIFKKLSPESQVYMQANQLTKDQLKERMKAIAKEKKEVKKANEINVGKIEELEKLKQSISVLPEKPTSSIEKELSVIADKKTQILAKKPPLLDSEKIEAEIITLKGEISLLEKKEFNGMADIKMIKEKISMANEFIKKPYKKKRPEAIKTYKGVKAQLEEYLKDIKEMRESLFKEGDSCSYCSSILNKDTSAVLNAEKVQQGKKLSIKIKEIEKQLEELTLKGKEANEEDLLHEKEIKEKEEEVKDLEKSLEEKNKELEMFLKGKKSDILKLKEKLKSFESNDVMTKNKEIKEKFEKEIKEELDEINKKDKEFRDKYNELLDFNAAQRKGKEELEKLRKRISELEIQKTKEESEIASLDDENKIVTEVFTVLSKYQRALLRKHLDKVDIELEKINKTTGEVDDIFKITYEGTLLNGCSFSEKIKAGIEISNLLIAFSGYNFPVFIDCAGEILDLPKIDALQYFTATAIKQDDLTINGLKIAV